MDPYVHFTMSLFDYHLHIALSKGYGDIIATPEFALFFSNIPPAQCDAHLTCTILAEDADLPMSMDASMSDRDAPSASILHYAFLKDMFTDSGPGVQKLIEPTRLVFFRPDAMDMRAYTCERSDQEIRSAIDFFLFLFAGSLLGRNQGLLLHACGLVLDGLACAVTGPSGAGKSTAGALMQKDFMLADDFIGITGIHKRILAHATPLSSTRITDGPCRAPLAAIFFPVKSDRFTIQPLAPRDAFLRYLNEHAQYVCRMIKPYKPVYFELAHILFHKVPAYELHFPVDYIDTEAIKKVMREGIREQVIGV